MMRSLFASAAFLAGVAAQLPTCDLGMLALQCNADGGLTGSQISAPGAPIEAIVQGASGLTTQFSNGCSGVMDRMFIGSDGAENHYPMACYVEGMESHDMSYSYDTDNASYERLVCNNNNFAREGACEMEVTPGAVDGEFILHGSCSHTTFIDSWVELCTQV
jgi:hypothetical protein